MKRLFRLFFVSMLLCVFSVSANSIMIESSLDNINEGSYIIKISKTDKDVKANVIFKNQVYTYTLSVGDNYIPLQFGNGTYEFEIFEKYSDIGMVGTNVSEFIDSIDNVVCDVILPETNDDIIKFSKSRNPFRHPSVMFKKSEVLKAGNYREYYLCEDYDMWLRMIRNGCKCYNIQDIYVYMRISDDFYKRRGGIKYLKSINKFKKEQVKVGYFTHFEYLKSIIPHSIVCLMPNFMRDLIYKKLLRKSK